MRLIGGLVMSAIKRNRGVKDWSQFIPGHGGMLDRVDSICFSAPLFFHLTHWLFRSWSRPDYLGQLGLVLYQSSIYSMGT